MSDKLETRIEELALSGRVKHSLSDAGIETVGALVSRSEDDLLSIKKFGRLSLFEIKSRLRDLGLSLRNSSIYSRGQLAEMKVSQRLELSELSNIRIDEIDLSVRAHNCLKAAGIETLGMLIKQTEADLLKIKYFGRKTLHEITSLLANVDLPKMSQRSGLSELQNLRSESQNIRLELQNIRIDEIDLSVRAQNCLKAAGIETLGMLIKQTEPDLLKIKNFGRKTLHEITSLLANLDSTLGETLGYKADTEIVGLKIIQEEKRCSSIEECLARIKNQFLENNNLIKYLKTERNVEIFRRRYGFGRDEETLDAIGKGIGITRERIRQISEKQIRTLSKSLGLSYRIYIKGFRKRIAKSRWVFPYEGDAGALNTDEFKLFNLIITSTQDKLSFDPLLKIWTKRHFDFTKRIAKYLEKKCMVGEAYSEQDINDFAEEYLAHNRKLKITIQFIAEIFKDNYFLSYQEGFLYKKLIPVKACEQVIKAQFPEGIFIYKDFDRFIEAAKSANITFLDGRNKRAIIGLILRSDNLCLWDWGKYIHKDNIKIGNEVLKEINRWIKRKLKEAPKISIWGAFRQFQDDCVMNGIPNEHALYSCMKIFYKKAYAFLKAPYIYDKDISSGIGQVKAVEDFIGSFKKGVDNEEILNALGIKGYQLAQALSNSDKIVKWGENRLIHIENIRIYGGDIKRLRTWVTDRIKRYEHISVIQVFQNNLLICQKNNIKCSVSLYSALYKNLKDEYSFPRYPYILGPDNSIPDDGQFSMNDIVRYYFEGKNGIVNQEEIYNYLVKERGYDERHVRNIRYLCEGIVKYAEDAYVSLDTIRWTPNKAIQLKELAIKKFDYNCEMKTIHSDPKLKLIARMSRKAKIGVPFVHVSEMLEEALPELDDNGKVKWTSVLLGELLDSLDGITVLGPAKGIFIKYPNDYAIESEEDLAYYILRAEYGGKTEISKLEKRLKELRIPISIKNHGNNPEEGKIRITGEMAILKEN